MQIWDIGGQTIGGKMIRNYIFGAHVRASLVNGARASGPRMCDVQVMSVTRVPTPVCVLLCCRR